VAAPGGRSRREIAAAELPLAAIVDDEPALLFDNARILLNSRSAA